MRDSDVPYVELTEAQRQRFEAAAERAVAARRRKRRSISKGRRGSFVWHIYRPTQPTMFGRARVQKGRASFSLRWVIGWVMW